jgi:hypothetical protein
VSEAARRHLCITNNQRCGAVLKAVVAIGRHKACRGADMHNNVLQANSPRFGRHDVNRLQADAILEAAKAQ